MRRHAAFAAALWLLGGCASVSRPPPELAGRLSVRVEAHDAQPARSVNTQFELRGDASAGELQLSTPLGSTAAQARWRPGQAELVTSDGTRRFADLDALAQELLGESLPLAALIEWLRGRPWAGAPNQSREGGFMQLGWQIDLSRIAEGYVQAGRERAPALTVRARLDKPE